jgi:hypothetical protein
MTLWEKKNLYRFYFVSEIVKMGLLLGAFVKLRSDY